MKTLRVEEPLPPKNRTVFFHIKKDGKDWCGYPMLGWHIGYHSGGCWHSYYIGEVANEAVDGWRDLPIDDEIEWWNADAYH